MENFSIPKLDFQEYFNKVEKKILGEVVSVSKALLESFKFNFIYHENVTKEQERKTEKAVKKYRTKFWTEALKQADGNKDKAYKIYTKNLN